MDPKCNVMILK